MNSKHASECNRHHIPWEAGPDDLFSVRRCAHLGDRFVVEIRATQWEGGFIDYVEDLPDGEVLVEGHSAYDYSQNKDREGIWEALIERMMRDDPPDTEKST